MKEIPSSRVPEGYARLPGAGYEALHPELQGVNPENYPDIHKMAILADVAPYMSAGVKIDHVTPLTRRDVAEQK